MVRGIAIDCMLEGQEKAGRVHWTNTRTMAYTQPGTGIVVSGQLYLLPVTDTSLSTMYPSKRFARRLTVSPIGLNICWPA